MNAAHLHLLLNHVPILGIPFSLLVLAHGLYRKNDEIIRLGCLFFIAVALITIPAYLTGEPAEEIIEKLPDFQKGWVHPHEEAGEVSFVLCSIAGALALLSLALKKNPVVRTWGPRLLALVALIGTGSLAYTAYLGGEIRHTEIRSAGPAPSSANPENDKD